ncbi:MAG: histidinol-phosphatase [Treponema sp.]|jgi:histidinol-phosphatase (PHP family)|nr:histidinol-phosphatase [Treponema sp.]
MRLSCLHTHTNFCDGQDDIETMIRAAWERGFASIGFSSHAPVAKKTGMTTGWHLSDDRLEEYCSAVRRARHAWKDRIAVFLGLEADYIRGLVSPADRDFQELGLDYIIGSVHYILSPQGEPVTIDGPLEGFAKLVREQFAGDGERLMRSYWEALREMIRAGGFDILGHADVIKKNNPDGTWFSLEGGAYREELEKTAALLGSELRAGRSLTVEINTGGLNRNKTPDTYPSLPLLRLLAAEGVPVTISADAHRAAELGGRYDRARENLLAAGYSASVFFEGRRAGRPLWTAENLED